LEEERE
jgi:hypothetical protein